MNHLVKLTLAAAALACAGHASAAITFYEHDDFRGRTFATDRAVDDLKRAGFNDRASSVLVRGDRSERWEVCEDRRFRGRCVILRPGDYPSLKAMGLNDRVSSVRTVDRNARYEDDRYAPMPAPTPPPVQTSQATFYEHDRFQGRSFTADSPVADFGRSNFNDRASSVVVSGGLWELCEDARHHGRCVVLRPGRYENLSSMGLNDRVSSVREVGGPVRAEERPGPQLPQPSQAVFFEHDGFQGRSFTAQTPIADFGRFGFNDRASSVVVRGALWEVCENARYGGRCVVLRPGQYPTLSSMGLNDRVSSVRALGVSARVSDDRYAPPPRLTRDYGRRNDERLYQANVTSVRAVVDTSNQRCWIEQEQVQQGRGNANLPGALLGAVIGGVIGHQVGGGSGRDLATGIGVIAGAAIGANQGRDGGQEVTTQNVQRCSQAPAEARPTYWDVTYNFRGVEHRVQMTSPPGATVQVNDQGEPRG